MALKRDSQKRRRENLNMSDREQRVKESQRTVGEGLEDDGAVDSCGEDDVRSVLEELEQDVEDGVGFISYKACILCNGGQCLRIHFRDWLHSC
jgi:hypothetical protein